LRLQKGKEKGDSLYFTMLTATAEERKEERGRRCCLVLHPLRKGERRGIERMLGCGLSSTNHPLLIFPPGGEKGKKKNTRPTK